MAAVRWLDDNDAAGVMNLGNGDGFSVFEVIRAVERVTGLSVAWDLAARRVGDPPKLVANSTYARNELNWLPGYTSMEAIVESAWRFHERFGK